jgi:hypothetical protein
MFITHGLFGNSKSMLCMADKLPKGRWLNKEIKGGIGISKFSIYLAKPI